MLIHETNHGIPQEIHRSTRLSRSTANKQTLFSCSKMWVFLRKFLWIPMDSIWIPMDSYGFLWIPMDSCRFLRIPLNSCGFLLVPEGSSEFLLIPIDSSEFL